MRESERRMRFHGVAAAITSVLAATVAVTPAPAAVVTVGSPLSATFTLGSVPGPYTSANTALGEAGSDVTSPVDGVVVGWQIAGGPPFTEGTGFELRVLRPAEGGGFTGAGTSAPATPIGNPAPASLPIHAGDLVGIDIPEGSRLAAALAPSSVFWQWKPQIADGSTVAAPVVTTEDAEVAFNAQVAPVPGITAIIEPSGSVLGGASVVVVGHDFDGASAVRFGATAAPSFSTRSDNAIVATAPPSPTPGPVDVSVTAPGGTTPKVAADRFTYTLPPVTNATHCVVPELRDKKLNAARRRASKAGCGIGRVKKLNGASPKTGRVVKQRPKAGKTVPAGSKITVTLR